VHFPLTLTKTGKSIKSWPFQASKGANCCNLSLSGLISTCTTTFADALGGAKYVSFPTANPFCGNSSPKKKFKNVFKCYLPFGGVNLKLDPSFKGIESVAGLKSNLPANAIAVTICIY
jgi:hypothetical protein